MRRAINLWFILGAAGLVAGTSFAETRTQHVFLVTADGLRHQEVFGGADPELLEEANKERSGIESLEAVRREYGGGDFKERREKLLPFFWKELAGQGIVIGNRSRGSSVRVRNAHHFSYPGYAEILVGEPLKAIDSNAPVWSPRETVLEFVRRKRGFDATQVAAFASWSVFNWITMSREGAIFCNAGYEPLLEEQATPSASLLNQIQQEMMTPWDTVRHDSVTLRLALDYIQAYRPRLFYLALGETDDWAHDRRYDRVLFAARLFDEALRRLWNLLQSLPVYRGKTTLIVTTDHGRGRGLEDWTSHGADVPGSDEIWIGVFGPDTPGSGELSRIEERYQSNIAATLLHFFGLDYREFNPDGLPPLPEAFLPRASGRVDR